jgi:hypothetical protein
MELKFYDTARVIEKALKDANAIYETTILKPSIIINEETGVLLQDA